MRLQRKVELIARSSDRMVSCIRDPRKDDSWWVFMRKESWIHFKRSLELLWMVIWRRMCKGALPPHHP